MTSVLAMLGLALFLFGLFTGALLAVIVGAFFILIGLMQVVLFPKT